MHLINQALENKIKDLALWLDYFIYLLFSITKFRKFPKSVNRILVIELLLIGDLINITPTIKALKKKFTNVKIDVLVLEKMKDVLSGNPNINKILIYENNFSKLTKKIRGNNYDLAVILHPGSIKISLALFLAKVKYRIGCTKVGLLTGKGFLLNKKIMPNTKIQHKVEDNLDVVRSIKANINEKKLELYTTKESDKKIDDLFKQNKIAKKDFKVVLHAAANYKSHEWLPERFANVADYLVKKHKAKVIFSGSNLDINLNNKIIKLMKNKAFNFAGTSIKEFFSLIKKADLVISVDTSAMHVAAAFNKEIIALFELGLGYPKVWYPYTNKRHVIVKGKSMKDIREEDVLKVIKEVLR